MIGWSNVISAVKDVSPLLGSAISASNSVAGMALSLISQSFGANKSDPEDILNKINADPEYKLKLKKIEYDHEEELARVSSEDYKNEVEDRKNARDRSLSLHDHMPNILAILFLIIYGVIQGYCTMHGGVNDIISARLQDILVMVFSFFFGSMHKRFTQG